MCLTDISIRKVKPADKPFKMFDKRVYSCWLPLRERSNSVAEKTPDLQSGMWCIWVSPLFGPCNGQLISITVKGYFKNCLMAETSPFDGNINAF